MIYNIKMITDITYEVQLIGSWNNLIQFIEQIRDFDQIANNELENDIILKNNHQNPSRLRVKGKIKLNFYEFMM